ncbi:beta,beta-carotene 15,15'-dioxygenase-like [Antedon mediterranea]|uniref:beta,beta-carotene 15,15'-dioxygenase-like n=1 Tax=Antedon mediterranea TaxID=105859 RepID=UPI003AF5362A
MLLRNSGLFFRRLGIASIMSTSINEMLTKTYLKDNPTPTEAVIEGALPQWLSGELLRTGPAIFEVGGQKMNHFFDGFAMLLRFTIKDGSVKYQSHFLNSETYRQSFKQNRIVVSQFGTASYPDPCKSIFHRFMSKFSVPELTDNGNVNIIPIADELYASSETQNLCKIDLDSMTNTEKVNIFRRNNIAVNTQTAHPHVESDGTVYNLGTAFSGRSCYKIVRFDAQKKESGPTASVVSTIPSSSGRNPSYYHSFGMTENYIILMEYPFIVDVLSLIISQFTGKTFFNTLSFDQAKPTYINIIDKKTGETVVKHKADAMFSFHHVNAFEKDGHIFMDLLHYDNIDIFHKLFLENIRKDDLNEIYATPRRFVLPLKVEKDSATNGELTLPAGTSCRAVVQDDGMVHCHSEVLMDVRIELPQMNYKEYNGKPYKYFYGVSAGFKELLKVDVENKTSVRWFEEGCHASEPVFVANPKAKEEDDGVVLSTVLDCREGKRPFLLVLNAKTFKEECRAVVPVEGWAYSLHGRFVSKF